MLYPEKVVLEEFHNNQEYEYLIDAPIFNDDIDIRDIAALESFYQKKGYIPEKYIPLLLNYVTYYARYNLSKGFDNPLTAAYRFQCSRAANINTELLEKMKIRVKQFNVGDIMGTEPIHELCEAWIPTMVDGKLTEKRYILDPTFRQFCIKEENRFERYNEEPRYSVRKATPHPAYFLNLYEDGIKLAKEIIRYGYFEATPQNLKIYFDSFYYYLKDKESYKDKSKLGKEYESAIRGEEYDEQIEKSEDKKHFLKSGLEIKTPLEGIIEARNKMRYRIKHFFTKKDDYQSNLDFDEPGMKL